MIDPVKRAALRRVRMAVSGVSSVLRAAKGRLTLVYAVISSTAITA